MGTLRLTLKDNNLGPEGGAKLMLALKQNTTLSVLNLNRMLSKYLKF